MIKYKVNVNVTLTGGSTSEVSRHLAHILSSYKHEIKSIEVVEDKTPKASLKSSPKQTAQPATGTLDKGVDGEQYVTYRVADEKFKLFAQELGIRGTELTVPKSRQFLQLRVCAFLEDLGYKVRPKVNIRVVAESHVEAVIPEAKPHKESGKGELIYFKRT